MEEAEAGLAKEREGIAPRGEEGNNSGFP